MHAAPKVLVPLLLLTLFAIPHAAQAADAPIFFFEGDMVLGRACVLSSQFKRTESVAWRVRVLDPKSGQSVDNKGLKTVVVDLSDGQKFRMRYGSHPKGSPTTDHFWSASWKIPVDYPTGSFSYTVVATDLQGHEVRWQPFKSAPSELTVVAN